MLISWLVGRFIPTFDGKQSVAEKLELESLVALLSDSEREQIQTSLDGNRKIETIELLRSATNAGLPDAKIAIEHMIQSKIDTA